MADLVQAFTVERSFDDLRAGSFVRKHVVGNIPRINDLELSRSVGVVRQIGQTPKWPELTLTCSMGC